MTNLDIPEAVKVYLREVSSVPSLTEPEQTDLLRQVKQGSLRTNA
jgi:hypothetical protein